ncbi:prolyl oligopeptidase family serine peptidase [Paenibacillus sp. TRM 82003]|nr:prolyl oligopeptidase family serine peptidase [Paenibacillus sp. TRM 82003]
MRFRDPALATQSNYYINWKEERMIYLITYYSDDFRVKGYLGLPPGAPRIAPAALQSAIESWYGAPSGHLPVELVADRARRDASGDVPGDVASPDRRCPAFPAFIYCRGGLGAFGRVRPHWVDAFAARGRVAFAPCYRGNEGGEGRDEFGGADREDVLAAIRLLRALPFVAPDRRAAVMGFSRGAVNAALAAAEAPDDVGRLILWAGVADLARTYDERVDLRRTLKRLLGGSPAKQPDAFRERSPIALVDRIACPVLVIHGTRDEQVDVGHGLAMQQALTARGAPVDLHLYERYGHLLPHLVYDAAVDRMYDWIDRDEVSPR